MGLFRGMYNYQMLLFQRSGTQKRILRLCIVLFFLICEALGGILSNGENTDGVDYMAISNILFF